LLAHCNSKKKVALANLFHEDLLSNIPINEKIALAISHDEDKTVINESFSRLLEN